jgi:hypothetical protein
MTPEIKNVETQEDELGEIQKNHPDEMKKARKASWLCDIFQENKLTVEDKQHVIKLLTKQN